MSKSNKTYYKKSKNHTFIPGDKFYSEADIKRMYSVKSITAVKALNELTTAGYLYRIQEKEPLSLKQRYPKCEILRY